MLLRKAVDVPEMPYFIIYNIALILFYPLILIFLAVSSLTNHKFSGTIMERLGRYPSSARGGPSIWVHAVSVGEAAGAAPLIRMLQKRETGRRIVVTTATKGGRDILLKEFGGTVTIAYFPLDFPWVAARAIKTFNPTALLLMETEIWPNIISACRRRGIPALLLNGRVSDRMAGAAGATLGMYKFALGLFDALAMQSESDAERIIKLGAPPEKTSVAGNIKFDGISSELDAEKFEFLRSVVGDISGGLLVAGSTHPGEEKYALDAFRQLRADWPALRMAIAPRHIERSGEALEICLAEGFKSALRSDPDKCETAAADVIVWDTIGELRYLYNIASACFVGGSLIERGGHNILEPAACGKAAFYGPHIANFRASAQALEAGGGGFPVAGPEELAPSIRKYLSDPELMKKMDGAALDVVKKNAGASEKIYALFKANDRMRNKTGSGRNG